MKISTLISAAVLAACACAPAAAEVVTYDYTATIYQIQLVVGPRGFTTDVDSTSIADETVSVGQTISGRFAYNTDTQPWAQYNSADGIYSRYNNLLPIGGRIDGTSLGLDTGSARSDIWISDRTPGQSVDYLSLYAETPYEFDVPQQGLTFQFRDPAGQAIGNAALAGLASLSGFPDAQVSYYWSQDFVRVITNANITSLTAVSPVPEPAVPLMWLTAGGVLALLRRRAGKAA